MGDSLDEIRRIKQKNARLRRQRKKRKIIALTAFVAVMLAAVIGMAASKSRTDSTKNVIKETDKSENNLAENNDSDEAENDMDISDIEASGDIEFSDDIENSDMADADAAESIVSETDENDMAAVVPSRDYTVQKTEAAVYMGSEEVHSEYGILLDADTMQVVAGKNESSRIVPASMTKILTLLVACENESDIEAPVQVTINATDYAYANGLAAAGFAENETVKVKDLMYGTILPSGADAVYALACHTAGDYDSFIKMMNDKLVQLGISDTAHFTNAVGLYDENHYCTPADMAVILAAAMDNPTAREVLSAHRYTTTATAEHPEGISLSNLFLRRIEDKDTLGEVVGAKTGFVNQSRNCAASYYTGNDGRNYICVTVQAHSAWRAIYDHVAVYNIYAAGNTSYHKG